LGQRGGSAEDHLHADGREREGSVRETRSWYQRGPGVCEGGGWEGFPDVGEIRIPTLLSY